jgi:hypothetical protein
MTRDYRQYLKAVGRKPPGNARTVKAPGSMEIVCERTGWRWRTHGAPAQEGRRFAAWKRQRAAALLLED